MVSIYDEAFFNKLLGISKEHYMIRILNASKLVKENRKPIYVSKFR